MRPARALVVAAAALLAAGGCALFTDLQGFDCGADRCADAAPADPDSSAPDASDGGAAGTGTPPGRCPSGRGPSMILAERFCIDATEVTAAQYARFIDDQPRFDAGAPPAVCANVTSHLPTCGYDPVGKPNRPVACVSWCDAWTFCRWAGKRLCGRIGTGAMLTTAQATDPATSEWMAACSRNGERAYPYGTVSNPSACATNMTETVDVGSSPGCEGGYPGLFDMNGNLEEWEGACDSVAAGGLHCAKRGNDFSGTSPTCGHSFPEDVFEANIDTGIRCCAD